MSSFLAANVEVVPQTTEELTVPISHHEHVWEQPGHRSTDNSIFLSDLPTDMRRGFLNSKKANDKPLYDGGGSTSSPAVIAPPKQLPPSSDRATVVSGPKKEPAVGYDFVEDILIPTLKPHAIFRIPSLTLTKSKEPYSTCILRTSSCRPITNTPGFYTPLPPQHIINLVSSKKTPDMGVGLFAKCNFKVNTVILSERPLLVFPPVFPSSGRSTQEEMQKYHDSLFEKSLQQALNSMAKEDMEAFISLSNSQPNLSPAHGVATTNAFDTGIEEDLRGNFSYCGVGKLISRINHSCTPNVGVEFDIPTFSFQIIARRDIEAGQQLFYCYRGLNRPVKVRRMQLLETYGFVCQCKACVNATPESDKLREEMRDKIAKICTGKELMFANPRFNIRSLDPLLRLEDEMIKEGLDFGESFVMLLGMIAFAYKKLHNMPKQREYLNKYTKITAGIKLDKYSTYM